MLLALLATDADQTNFAPVTAARHDHRGRPASRTDEGRAGTWFGLAAALKAFPALLLVYLALRRSWRAFGIGVAVATLATLLPLVPYGPDEAVTAIRSWLTVGLNQEQWQLAASDQSLRSLALRLGAPSWVAVAVVLLLLVGLAIHVTWRRRTAALPGAGATAMIAVLATPVAWVHYFVLAFPAWIALFAQAGRPPQTAAGGEPAVKAAYRPALMWLAAIATSGWLTFGSGPLRRAIHGANLYTWGGLLVLLLLAMHARHSSTENE